MEERNIKDQVNSTECNDRHRPRISASSIYVTRQVVLDKRQRLLYRFKKVYMVFIRTSNIIGRMKDSGKY